jgi:YT521-B-like domain
MAGQILRGEASTPWAPAIEFTPPPSSVSSLSDMSAGASPFHDGTDAERQDSLYIFPLDEDRVDQQPQSALGCWPSFALAERHKPAGRLTNSMPNMNTRPTHHSVQASSLPVLISDALSHSLRYPLTRGSRESSSSLDAVSVSRLVGHDADLDDKPNPAPDGSFEGRDTSDDAAGSAWDLSFHIEWIRTDSLPFFRTCHLRNPWNHGREVKVSRDGTELEPKIGQQLLDEWDRRILALGSLPGPSRTPSRPPTRGLRSTKAFPPRLFPT